MIKIDKQFTATFDEEPKDDKSRTNGRGGTIDLAERFAVACFQYHYHRQLLVLDRF